MIRRGEIYWVNFDPTVGSEIRKVRPALIISNNENNQFSDLITLLPITSKAKKIFPFETHLPKGVGGIKEEGKIKANQIRTVDKKRIVGGPMGPALEEALMHQVEIALKIHLALD